MPANPVLNDQRWGAVAGTRPGHAGTITGAESKQMTIGGTALSTGVLLVLLSITGVWGYMQVEQTYVIQETTSGPVQVNTTSPPAWMWLSIIGGLAFALVTVFKPTLARITAPLYALTYGIAVGMISAVYAQWQDGIVVQAVLATVTTFFVVLALYVFRVIRATRRFVLTIVAATGGIFLMYLVSFVVSLFSSGGNPLFEPTALGIGVSIAVCIVAALNLILDFAFIEGATQQGAPKYMEWYGAFGVTVTLVWLYLEFLRLLSLLNRS